VKKKNHKPLLPKSRLCFDPHTKYCIGHKNSKTPYGHRGCCDCHEYNIDPSWDNPCNPWMLPENLIELKQWWLSHHPEDNWDDTTSGHWRPKMKVRGGR
jgi:hypothetical protein